MFQKSITARFALGLICAAAGVAQAQYGVHNLVSDGYTWAPHIDPNLVNPWGISESSGGPFWVSNNGSATSTLYNTAGTPLSLIVAVPGAPTGQVFNGSGDFKASNGTTSGVSRFIFASEDGTISGWAPSVSFTSAFVIASKADAIYKGLAIGSTGGSNFLYASNFSSGMVDIFDGTNSYVSSFTDATLPAGYAPFNVQNLNGSLYVTYALKGSGHDELHGAGLGFVDRFDMSGNLISRVGSNGALNAPWGVAIAPSTFGAFRGDLLVGNFGDGTINAFDLTTNTFAGTLTDKLNNPLWIDGLWGLQFGNGGIGGHANDLYFTAGPVEESHGLFGVVTTVPAPSALIVMGFGILARVRRRKG